MFTCQDGKNICYCDSENECYTIQDKKIGFGFIEDYLSKDGDVYSKPSELPENMNDRA